MRMSKEERIRILKSIGKYIIDNAESLVHNEPDDLINQVMIVQLQNDSEIPNFKIISSYRMRDAIVRHVEKGE